VKLHAEGILPTEAVWEDLGYSPQRQAKLRQQFADQRADPILSALLPVPQNSQVGAASVPAALPIGTPGAAPAGR
jgi:peptidoglycan hydrolase-like protein with peptidoglycan-binding domain